MPGYVEEYSKAIEKLENVAPDYDYNVRVWLKDWIRDVGNTPGNENLTKRQILEQAVYKTEREIRGAVWDAEELANREDNALRIKMGM